MFIHVQDLLIIFIPDEKYCCIQDCVYRYKALSNMIRKRNNNLLNTTAEQLILFPVHWLYITFMFVLEAGFLWSKKLKRAIKSIVIEHIAM